MKEILVNTISDVYYDVFKNGVLTDATGNVTVSVYKDGIKLISSDLATKIPGKVGKYSYTLPVSVTPVGSTVATGIVTEEAELQLEWTFSIGTTPLTVKDVYRVVTPYSPWSYFNDAGTPYSDYLECERIARHIINSHCGQEFGKKLMTYTVEGHGTDSLKLPWRLITLTSVTYLVPNSIRSGGLIGYGYPDWEVASHGWVLRLQPNRVTLDPVWPQTPMFRRNMLYYVKGTWGHETIPGAIGEASKILIADYLCQDHKYRDKYLQQIKMNQWSLQFSDRAYSGTGNATADSLLLDHRNYPAIGLI